MADLKWIVLSLPLPFFLWFLLPTPVSAETEDQQHPSSKPQTAPANQEPSTDLVDQERGEDEQSSSADELEPDRSDWGVIPLFGLDSDTGTTLGASGLWVKFKDEKDPFFFKLAGAFALSFKDQNLQKQNYFLFADIPEFLGSKTRVTTALYYGRQQNKPYFGVGNQSQYVPSDDPTRYHYDVIYPEISTYTDTDIVGPFSLLGGIRYRYSLFDFYPGSLLDEHSQYIDESGIPLLPGTDNHGELILALGARFDTRNHEVATTRGMFHQISGRYSPGAITGTRYHWGGTTMMLRFYRGLFSEYLILAMRLCGDLIFGTAPFYELETADAFPYFSMPAGGKGIRGIPVGRYRGKIKLVANHEVRSMIIRFKLRKTRFKLGTAAFFDAGRVWTDYETRPELDGTGFGLKWGVGGGLRAQVGEAIMGRIDVGWSPDANPIGFYFALGNMF